MLGWTHDFPSTTNTSTSLAARLVTMELRTDASGLVRWGGHCSRGRKVQGCWMSRQEPWHINLKEMEAERFSLEALMLNKDVVNLFMDSRVAVAFFNRQGGTNHRSCAR